MRITSRISPAAGFALMEAMIAISLLVVALAIGAVAIGEGLRARRQQDARVAARELLTLGLERARLLDTAAIPETGATWDLGVPPEFASRLPGARCTLTAFETAPGWMEIRLAIDWPGCRDSISDSILFVTESRP